MANRRKRNTRRNKNLSTASLLSRGSMDSSDIHQIVVTSTGGAAAPQQTPRPISPIRGNMEIRAESTPNNASGIVAGSEQLPGNEVTRAAQGPSSSAFGFQPLEAQAPIFISRPPTSYSASIVGQAVPGVSNGNCSGFTGREVVHEVSQLLLPILERLDSLELRYQTGEVANGRGRSDRPRYHVAFGDQGMAHQGSIHTSPQSVGPHRTSAFAGVHTAAPASTLTGGTGTRGPSMRSQHLKTSDIKIPIYGGAHEVKTPYEFLAELDRYRKAVGYTESEMLAHVVPLSLRDDAELWYRKVHQNLVTWQEFQAAFRREFQSPLYMRKLRRELEDRFQGPHEPLTKFIYVIDDYFQRLDPTTPQKVRADRIIQNMHPDYRRQILAVRREFNSVEEILRESYEAQASLAWDREYKVPENRGSIEPVLSYKLPQWASQPEQVATMQYQRSAPMLVPEIQPSSFDRFAYFHQQGYHRQNNVRFNRDRSGEREGFNRPKSPYNNERRHEGHGSIQFRPERHDSAHLGRDRQESVQSRPERHENAQFGRDRQDGVPFRPISPRPPGQALPASRPLTPVSQPGQGDRSNVRPPTPFNPIQVYRTAGQNGSRPNSPGPQSSGQGSRPASPGLPAYQGNGQRVSRA